MTTMEQDFQDIEYELTKKTIIINSLLDDVNVLQEDNNLKDTFIQKLINEMKKMKEEYEELWNKWKIYSNDTCYHKHLCGKTNRKGVI